jgi:hypothetical protein
MVVYMLTNDRRFRRYDFQTTTELLKLYFGQITVWKENIKSRTVWMGFLHGAE